MTNNVFAIAGGKGGVGKTAVTVNVGIALQELGYDVAAVDADLAMTNLGELLEIDADTGIHHALAGNAVVEDVLVEGPNGLDVVPGTGGLGEVGGADPANLKTVLTPLRESHDIVLIDTGAGVSHQNLVALGLADATVLVTTPSEIAATDAAKTAAMVDRADGTVAGIVITRISSDADREKASEIAETLGVDLLSTVPEYEDVDAPEPRYSLASDTPATSAYSRLAAALSVYHETGDAAAAADRGVTERKEQTVSSP